MRWRYVNDAVVGIWLLCFGSLAYGNYLCSADDIYESVLENLYELDERTFLAQIERTLRARSQGNGSLQWDQPFLKQVQVYFQVETKKLGRPPKLVLFELEALLKRAASRMEIDIYFQQLKKHPMRPYLGMGGLFEIMNRGKWLRLQRVRDALLSHMIERFLGSEISVLAMGLDELVNREIWDNHMKGIFAKERDSVVTALVSVVQKTHGDFSTPDRAVLLSGYFLPPNLDTVLVYHAAHAMQSMSWDLWEMMAYFENHVLPHLSRKMAPIKNAKNLGKLAEAWSDRFIANAAEIQPTMNVLDYIWQEGDFEFLSFLSFWKYVQEFHASYCAYCYEKSKSCTEVMRDGTLGRLHRSVLQTYSGTDVHGPIRILPGVLDAALDPNEVMKLMAELEGHPLRKE